MNHEMLRRVRYWIGKAEDALDLGAVALRRAGAPLDDDWRQEFESDVSVMQDKIDKLREAIKTLA